MLAAVASVVLLFLSTWRWFVSGRRGLAVTTLCVPAITIKGSLGETCSISLSFSPSSQHIVLLLHISGHRWRGNPLGPLQPPRHPPCHPTW